MDILGKYNKHLEKFVFIFLVVSTPLVIMGFNFILLFFDYDFYEKEFVRNGVYDKFGEEVVDETSLLLINYLRDDREYLDTDFFNEDEKLHLRDVKNLINNFLFLFYVTLILFSFSVLSLIYLRKYDKLAYSFIFGATLTVVLLLIFILFGMIDFNYLFVKFHMLIFTNDLWILNPTTDNLINLFPERFFYDFFQKVMLNGVITTLFFVSVGSVIRYREKLIKIFKK